MGVALLDLVETALRVAKQALGKRAGKPDSGGLAREAHIVAHYIRKEEGHSYAELVDRVSLMPAVCDRLGIHPDAPLDPTTFYHSFDRYAMYSWRALLRISAQHHFEALQRLFRTHDAKDKFDLSYQDFKILRQAIPGYS